MLRVFQEFGKRLMGMSPTVFWGISIHGEDWGFLPKRVRCVTVVGKPIRVEQRSRATDEAITDLREIYIKELRSLYNRYKEAYDPDRKEDMKIVD